MAAQLESVLARTLPGVDITRPIVADDPHAQRARVPAVNGG
jgi:hypothetical protein